MVVYCIGQYGAKTWKIKGWNLQPSPMERKEHDLNQTSMIMFHVNLQGCSRYGCFPYLENLFFGEVEETTPYQTNMYTYI